MLSARQKFLAAFAGLVLLVAWGDWQWLRLTDALSLRVMDAFVKHRSLAQTADPQIAIVDIDERSLAGMIEHAGRWPWPRSVHGELAAGIAAQKPRAIVFDIMFAEPDYFNPDHDRVFNELVRPLANVYFPTARHDASGDPLGQPIAELERALGAVRSPVSRRDARIDVLRPLALAPENWRLGLINFLQDRDGVGRRYGVYLDAYGWKIPSLPVRVAVDQGWDVPSGEDMIIGWRGGVDAHPRVSYVDLYEDVNRERKTRPADEFRDRIVIIGATATGLHDIRVTPISNVHPGVEILASAIDSVKNRTWLEAAPRWTEPAIAVALIALLAGAFLARMNTLVTGSALAVATLAVLAASYLLLSARVWTPVVTPVIYGWIFFLATVLRDALDERRSREAAVREFSRFVNPHVVQELIAKGGLSRQGESREVTLLFSDIRGFTTLSETRTPQQIVDILNRYFSKQVAVLFRHQGTLDKFIGDAIMAVWGAPVDDPDHAKHAVAAALEMADTLLAFREELGEVGLNFDVGIGVHSGPAVVGLIGSDARREYTAIGDTVNLASRIEGLTKGVARILVSEDTRRMCGDAFEFIDRGAFKVKGRAQDVRLYEPKRKTT
ncbi:MAG: adenylate/guanylate cyclase domain-containing protein [Betaproteobacteria bacterium]|nr:adenylate/guanylate cyclase domain-containing protein [Betaproteobacteria bacterium]